jgi:hypothetical protein
MHAYMVNSKGLRKRSSWLSSRFKLKIDPQNSSITTFTFCSVDTPYSNHLNRRHSSGLVLTSRSPNEGRPLIERMACDPLLNTADACTDTSDHYSPGIDGCAQEILSPIPRHPMRRHSMFPTTTLPSLARSPHDEDVFSETKPLDHAQRPYRGDSTNTAVQRADIRSLPTLPTLSSDSSGSSISTLATPASPSPAPRHIRRAQGRLSLPMPTPTPTPTPSAAEPSRRAHARMSLVFPIPTPGSASSGTESSRAGYRKSLDLSELARCRLWDAKGNVNGRENVRVRDKENMQWRL